MRSRLFRVVAVLLPLLTLTSCASSGESPAVPEASSLTSSSPLCLQMANAPGRVGKDTYPTDEGRLALDGDELQLVRPDGAETMASGVSRIVDVREFEGVTHVFFLRPIDEEESHLMVVTRGDEPRFVAVGEAPEYMVIAVSRGPVNGNWLLTAVADLTEVIFEVDTTGAQVRFVEPYEYNRGPSLLLAEPLEDGGFFLLEAPVNSNGEWSVAFVGEDGSLRTRLPVPSSYGTPTGWYDRAREGEIVLGLERSSLVVGYTSTEVTFTECATVPLDRIIRR